MRGSPGSPRPERHSPSAPPPFRLSLWRLWSRRRSGPCFEPQLRHSVATARASLSRTGWQPSYSSDSFDLRGSEGFLYAMEQVSETTVPAPADRPDTGGAPPDVRLVGVRKAYG